MSVRERQLELLKRNEMGLRRVPELTGPMRLALEAIELCNGRPLSEARFRRHADGDGVSVVQFSPRVLKRLICEGLIEVMGLAPAVYRLTKPGRVARSLGARS
jgi:hypothetical protein